MIQLRPRGSREIGVLTDHNLQEPDERGGGVWSYHLTSIAT
jgi:hypothetical protein